ncbi:MAG: hypothetical protein JXA73_07065 [Acidobacteria bacterium]|nr:hypothetical protein [Acidobacteriota bacterium]
MAICSNSVRSFIILLILFPFSNIWALAADVLLEWDPSPSANISEYRVYFGNYSRAYNSSVAVVDQTRYRVTDLGLGTWYFAVTAVDVDGSESDFSNEVSRIVSTEQSENDTTPPVITEVTSSGIAGTRAVISWKTSEAANTQVDYGPTAAYGSSTILRDSLVTSHAEVLTGLAESTLYHYRVRSRDAAGNLAVSSDHVFTTAASGGAPIISGVEISEITERSALISWETNKAADSQVEYWQLDKPMRRSALDSFRTHHSIRLNNLQRKTLYYFRIKSADLDNLQSMSTEYVFTTQESGYWIKAVPRFADRQVEVKPGDEHAIGVALTNSDTEDADMLFSALDEEGKLMSGPGITNPRPFQMNPQIQHAMLDVEIFGFALEPYGTKGWIAIESSAPALDGFFLLFDSKLSYMDGTSLGNAPLSDFIFTDIEPNGSTRINIINENSEEAEVIFELMTGDGSLRSYESRMITGRGALIADLYEDLFEGVEPEPGDYVRMNSTKRVHSFALLEQEEGDVSLLAGQDMSEGGTTLYSPQYVVGGDMHTTLSIINLDSRAGTVELQFLGEDGVQIGMKRVLPIAANGKLRIDDVDFFCVLEPGRMAQGYIKITSDGVRMSGSTIFGHSDGQSYTTALPLIYQLHDSVIFSHVASDDVMFTGLAIVNPGEDAATVLMQLYSPDGRILDYRDLYIPAGQRITKVLTEFFPSLIGKAHCNGHIRLISNKPLASFALFGTIRSSVLSAIPLRAIE